MIILVSALLVRSNSHLLTATRLALADDKTPPPPLPTAKNIFGVSLSVVSEYGFVTSMIAGQRHDLPGVCFSTVEEIYRRGQGESSRN